MAYMETMQLSSVQRREPHTVSSARSIKQKKSNSQIPKYVANAFTLETPPRWYAQRDDPIKINVDGVFVVTSLYVGVGGCGFEI